MRIDAIVADRLGTPLPAHAAVRRARAAQATPQAAEQSRAVETGPRTPEVPPRVSASVRVMPAGAPGGGALSSPPGVQGRVRGVGDTIAPTHTGVTGDNAGFLEIFHRERSVLAFQMPFRTPSGMGQLMYLLEVETAYRVVQPLPQGGLIDVEA